MGDEGQPKAVEGEAGNREATRAAVDHWLQLEASGGLSMGRVVGLMDRVAQGRASDEDREAFVSLLLVTSWLHAWLARIVKAIEA